MRAGSVPHVRRICDRFVSDLLDVCRICVGVVADLRRICQNCVGCVSGLLDSSDVCRIRVRGEACQCWNNNTNTSDATQIQHKCGMTQHKYNTDTP